MARVRTSFYQVVMEGSPKMARGLVTGLRLQQSEASPVFFHEDAGIHDETLTDKLAEIMRLHAKDCFMVVEGSIAQILKKNARRIEDETGLRLIDCRHIRGASFEFSFEAFAERYGKEILARIRGLPEGVRLEDFAQREEHHPEAAGIESYASAHAYEMEGGGRVVGPVDRVIQARMELQEHPLVEVEDIHLKLA